MIFICHGVPHLVEKNKFVNVWEFPLIVLTIISTFASFFKASWSNPGIIDRGNSKSYQEMYPYDYLMYTPKFCDTCLFDKPPRSKHCSMCKCCVARLDHHCVWINNCVGYLNHKWFMAFLVCTANYCLYGSYLSFQILRFIYYDRRFDRLQFVDPATGHPIRDFTDWESYQVRVSNLAILII